MRDPHPDPKADYTARLEALTAELSALTAQDRQIANGRLVLVAAAAVLAWLAFVSRVLPPAWLLLPIILFGALVIYHDGILQRLARARFRTQYYERGMARLEERWTGGGSTGEAFRDPAHPYADDLDLFGRGSLFELLCTARTRSGEETLASWLRAPAEPVTIRSRQEAIRDLKPRPELREELAVGGSAVSSELDAEALIAWGEAPVWTAPAAVRVAAMILAAAGVAALGLWIAGYGWWWLVGVAAVQWLFSSSVGKHVSPVVRDVEQPARALSRMLPLLRRLERETFAAPHLTGLVGMVEGHGPSERLERLDRIVSWLHAQRNGVLAVLAALLLWNVHCAIAIEAWRARNGKHLRDWIHIVGEMEALCSLATFAYEHPGLPFPEIVEQGPCFEAAAIAHPLLPHEAAVANDVELGGPSRLLIVSGSNMSGKSTLMRAVGVNAVLALAGAPVRARHLRLSPLALGASLRIQDSLQSGVSHFYAEITRLRQVVDLADGPLPLLFLLDEILHGTNSHDRCIGAEAVLRALVRKGAVGIVTTHDLALTRLADDPILGAVNIHFQDELLDGKMHFDYRLREGVVRKSNALELMQAVGLDV